MISVKDNFFFFNSLNWNYSFFSVNNVGVLKDKPKLFALDTENEIWSVINVNIAAATMMTKIILPNMIRRRKGAVINVGSIASIHPVPYTSTYSGSKVIK